MRMRTFKTVFFCLQIIYIIFSITQVLLHYTILQITLFWMMPLYGITVHLTRVETKGVERIYVININIPLISGN